MGSDRPEQHRAAWMTDQMIEATAEADNPWFGYVHYWDTHMGYTADAESREYVADREYEDGDKTIEELAEEHPENPVMERFGSLSDVETVGDLKRRYDAAVRYVDAEFGRMLNTLSARGELEDTLIIVTADHGECLTENGVLFDHRELYDPTWHVPLIIHGPEFSGVDDRFVQHFDIAPTILDAADIDYERSRFDGWSLVSSEEEPRRFYREAVFAEQIHNARQRGIRTRSFKYVKNLQESRRGRLSGLDRPDEQLYDLEADPGERANIAEKQPEVVKGLDERLRTWIENVPDPEQAPVDVTHPSEEKEMMDQLEALGYNFY